MTVHSRHLKSLEKKLRTMGSGCFHAPAYSRGGQWGQITRIQRSALIRINAVGANTGSLSHHQ